MKTVTTDKLDGNKSKRTERQRDTFTDSMDKWQMKTNEKLITIAHDNDDSIDPQKT